MIEQKTHQAILPYTGISRVSQVDLYAVHQ